MPERIELLTIGEAMVEFDERESGVWHQGVGGDTLNVAVAAARTGARVGFASAVGNDAWGRRIESFCQDKSIDTRAFEKNAELSTGLYFVRHSENGHEFTYRRAGSAATRYGFSKSLDVLMSECDVVHFSGISLAVAEPEERLFENVFDCLVRKSARFSFDVNYRPKLWSSECARAPISATMKRADILMPGLEDLSMLFGIEDADAAIEFCMKFAPEILVLKNGKEDIHVVHQDQRHVISPPSVEAKDANGAGDCFAGTFLGTLIAGQHPAAAASKASEMAAKSVLSPGALSLPSKTPDH